MNILINCLLFFLLIDFSKQEIGTLQYFVDLTWPFNNNTIYWKGVRSFTYVKRIAEAKEDGTWYAMNEFCAGEHGGTHFDAPYHFNKNGLKVGDIPLTRLIAPAAVLHVQSLVQKFGNDFTINAKHLEAWERKNGKFPYNGVLLVDFGWSQHYSNKTQYFGEDADGSFHFPGLSFEAARWIASNTTLVGIGVDTPSVDRGRSKSFEVHKILAEHQIYGLENVNIPADLPVAGFCLFVMPMKLTSGTGAPLRILAVPCDKSFLAGSNTFMLSGTRAAVSVFGHILFSILIVSYYILSRLK